MGGERAHEPVLTVDSAISTRTVRLTGAASMGPCPSNSDVLFEGDDLERRRVQKKGGEHLLPLARAEKMTLTHCCPRIFLTPFSPRGYSRSRRVISAACGVS